MWIFTKNSFISVVHHPSRPNDVMVRARRKSDLARLFPKKQITKTPNTDYMWRTVVSKKELAKVLATYISTQLTYDNFKAAQSEDSPYWHKFLLDVWEAGFNMESLEHSRELK